MISSPIELAEVVAILILALMAGIAIIVAAVLRWVNE